MTNTAPTASSIGSPLGDPGAQALTILTRLRAEPDTVDAVRAILAAYAQDVRSFEGGLCTDYRVLTTPGDPLRIVIIARYISEAAYQAHLNATHTISVMPIMQPLLAGDPVLEVYLG